MVQTIIKAHGGELKEQKKEDVLEVLIKLPVT